VLTCQNNESDRPFINVGRGYRVAPFYFGQSYRIRTRPTHSEYLDIRNISQRLYRDFTASKTTFFAIGRSPTPIAAYLAHMPDVHIENVPGSLGLRRDSLHISQSRELSELMSGLPQRTRQLVLIDYCLTGTTLAFFLRMARDYAQRENLQIEILGAALVHEPSQAQALHHADIESAIKIYQLADFPVLRACLFREDYDRLAPFPSRPSMSTDSCRQIYETYCRNLRECILYDSSNSAFRSLHSTSERALWMRN
jgi:hypothetical protein